eukprot:TRINITY_DN5616_c0_g1_i2.p1 TRINITY_DN5616_c0_g1~~TRINITY_DN5616_c0_g1_i2.p1  ORF type:complete len:435 (-),score=88.79 TRINITY_DN5616_c0_g1_i2:22-1326(-)
MVSASWCGPCKKIEPVFDSLQSLHPNVKFIKVDADSSPHFATMYKINSVPSFLFFVGHQLVLSYSSSSDERLKENISNLSQKNDREHMIDRFEVNHENKAKLAEPKLSGSWKKLDLVGDHALPVSRGYHSGVVIDSDQLFVVGGCDGITYHKVMNDAYIFDLKANEWKTVPTFEDNIYRHSCTYHPETKQTIMFGGGFQNDVNKPIKFSNRMLVYNHIDSAWTWKEFVGDVVAPSPRYLHYSYIVGDQLIIFGGISEKEFMNDMWIYHISKNTWEKVDYVGSPPEGLSEVSSALYKDKIIHFGGRRYYGPNGIVDTLYIYHINEKRWEKIETKSDRLKPSSRVGASGCVIGDFFYIFGGSNNKGAFMNELWRLNLSDYSWQQLKPNGVPPNSRDRHSVVNYNDKMYIFGGYDGYPPFGFGHYNDIWIFDPVDRE